MTIRDAVAILRLAHEIEHEDARWAGRSPAPDGGVATRPAGWHGGLPLPAVRHPGGQPSAPRLQGGGNLAQCLARFRLIRPSYAVKLAEQVAAAVAGGAGGSTEPVRMAATTSCFMAFQALLGLCLRAAQRRPGDLDDRELLCAMQAQRHLDEPELRGL